jgi:hypothetical protein
MPVWDSFRAIAARLGLSREEVERVEAGGEPSLVQHPLDPRVQIRVRPDPDWTARMSDAWYGELVNSRRESAGTLAIGDGRLTIGNADQPEQGMTLEVTPGEYEVTLTIAHLGEVAIGTYEEHVSHVWALLRGTEDISVIEPMKAANGTEVWLELGKLMFTGSGVREQLAAEHPQTGLWQVINLSLPGVPVNSGQWSTRIATRDSTGALITVMAGYGSNSYPLFKLADANGRLLGVLLDFYVDNRPWDS